MEFPRLVNIDAKERGSGSDPQDTFKFKNSGRRGGTTKKETERRMGEREGKLGKRHFQQSGEGMISYVELGNADKKSGSGIFGAKC